MVVRHIFDGLKNISKKKFRMSAQRIPNRFVSSSGIILVSNESLNNFKKFIGQLLTPNHKVISHLRFPLDGQMKLLSRCELLQSVDDGLEFWNGQN